MRLGERFHPQDAGTAPAGVQSLDVDNISTVEETTEESFKLAGDGLLVCVRKRNPAQS